MLAEIGIFFTYLAILFTAIPLLSLCYSKLQQFYKPAIICSAICVLAAFITLIYAFIVSDFSLKLVFTHSHTQKPLIYKITATWGNHEGSMLLLCLVVALFNILISSNRRASIVQSFISLLFLVYLVALSNPFASTPFTPAQGTGFNPILQDIGLAMHPPLLYIGYIGFSAVFSMAVAILWRGEFSQAAVKQAHKYCLIAWGFLTLGIGLGSWWAYRELGWGGYWFWDPVENAALMPWLSGTALLHSIIVAKNRGIFKKWLVLLAILTFVLSLLGLFLVRSGILTSVHSFASAPGRGLAILVIISAISLPALFLYGLRANKLQSNTGYKLASAEGMLSINNMLLMVACAVVLVGTLYPLGLDAITGEQITVGAPYFNLIFTPLASLLLIACGIGSLAKWNQDKKLLKSLLWPLIAGVLACLFFTNLQGQYIALTFALGFAFACIILIKNTRNKLPMVIAHIGLLVMVIGIFTSSVYEQQNQQQMQIKQQIKFAGFDIKFTGIKEYAATNYAVREAQFNIFKGNTELGNLKPQMRYYPIEDKKTTEAANLVYNLGDIYFTLGRKIDESTYVVRLYYKPLINLIWVGIIMMFIGGITGVFVRRYN